MMKVLKTAKVNIKNHDEIKFKKTNYPKCQICLECNSLLCNRWVIFENKSKSDTMVGAQQEFDIRIMLPWFGHLQNSKVSKYAPVCDNSTTHTNAANVCT